MTFSASIETITASLSGASEKLVQSLVPVLESATLPKGEFPSPLSLIEKIRVEIGSDSARPEKAAALMSSCPVTALRIIAVANSAFYARGNPVETVLGAVNHLGLRRMRDVVEGLAEKKSFQATFLGRSIASGVLQQTMIANILSSELALMSGGGAALADRAFVLSSLLRLPPLMLAYTRPSVYAACLLDAANDLKSTFERNFKKLMGESVSSVAVTLAEGLSFPIAIAKSISYLDVPPWNRRSGADEVKDLRSLAICVFLAHRLAEEVCRCAGFLSLDTLIEELSEKSGFKPKDVKSVVGDMPQLFLERAAAIGLKPSRLPEYVAQYRSKMVGADGEEIPDKFKYPGIAERINPFLYELRACFNTRAKPDELSLAPQAVLCTLSALVKGLTFDRAVFFRYDERAAVLRPTVVFGVRPQELSLVDRKLSSPEAQFMPDVQAVLQRKATFTGDPVFGDAWPFVAFPVICAGKVEGVFFADKLGRKTALPLDTQEQVAAVALAEGWYEVAPEFR